MEGEDKQNTDGTPANEGVVGDKLKPSRSQSLRRLLGKIKTHKREALIGGILLLIIIVSVSISRYYSQNSQRRANETNLMNTALQNKDEAQALEHARNALALAPNDLDTILAAASITAKYEPEEAKKLYGRALNAFKKQDDPDVDGKPAVTYWAAAGLAEKAGQIDRAKKYYRKAVEVADLKDSYDQYIMNDSQTGITRLEGGITQ